MTLTISPLTIKVNTNIITTTFRLFIHCRISLSIVLAGDPSLYLRVAAGEMKN